MTSKSLFKIFLRRKEALLHNYGRVVLCTDKLTLMTQSARAVYRTTNWKDYNAVLKAHGSVRIAVYLFNHAGMENRFERTRMLTRLWSA